MYLLLTHVILLKDGVKALIRFHRRPIVRFKSEKHMFRLVAIAPNAEQNRSGRRD